MQPDKRVAIPHDLTAVPRQHRPAHAEATPLDAIKPAAADMYGKGVEPRQQVSVRLLEPLHARLRVHCAHRRIRMQALIERLVEEHLDKVGG